MLVEAHRAANVPRGRHGLPLADATDFTIQDQWVAEPTVDFAQKTLNATQKEWRDTKGELFDMDAMLWRVRRQSS